MSSEEKIDLGEIQVEEISHKSHRRHRHHGHHRHHRTSQERKKAKRIKVIKRCLLVLLLICIALAATPFVLYFTGQRSIRNAQSEKPDLSNAKSVTATDAEKEEGILHYNGKTYRYRDNNINLLFMGIDSMGAEENLMIQGAGNGQSDVLVLVNFNQKEEKLTMIPINRDTMTRIGIYDQNDEFVKYENKQIALSYSYGKTAQSSAEHTKDAVSHLFYGMPIQGWFSMNISGISVLNDLVGGVEVVLPEDYVEEWGDGYFKGAKVLLKNTMAETYIRKRYNVADGTNASRMDRQKAYLIALIQKMIGIIRKNPAFPVQIYQGLNDYMESDIGPDEFTYLAATAVQYGFSENNILSLKGKLEIKDHYQYFYPDEKALYDLILSVFYDEI